MKYYIKQIFAQCMQNDNNKCTYVIRTIQSVEILFPTYTPKNTSVIKMHKSYKYTYVIQQDNYR